MEDYDVWVAGVEPAPIKISAADARHAAEQVAHTQTGIERVKYHGTVENSGRVIHVYEDERGLIYNSERHHES